MTVKILLIDDCEEIFLEVKECLPPGTDLTFASSVTQAQNFIKDEHYDIFIVDLLLPDGNGISFCKEVRSVERFTKSFILILSAMGEVETKVLALESGVDDYLVKPFAREELRARCVSMIRKLNILYKDFLKFESLLLDLSMHRIFHVEDSKKHLLDFTPIEYKILLCLIKSNGKYLTRDELLSQVWTKDVHVVPENVYTHISSLRNKLRKCSLVVHSSAGKGYIIKSTSAPNSQVDDLEEKLSS